MCGLPGGRDGVVPQRLLVVTEHVRGEVVVGDAGRPARGRRAPPASAATRACSAVQRVCGSRSSTACRVERVHERVAVPVGTGRPVRSARPRPPRRSRPCSCAVRPSRPGPGSAGRRCRRSPRPVRRSRARARRGRPAGRPTVSPSVAGTRCGPRRAATPPCRSRSSQVSRRKNGLPPVRSRRIAAEARAAAGDTPRVLARRTRRWPRCRARRGRGGARCRAGAGRPAGR